MLHSSFLRPPARAPYPTAQGWRGGAPGGPGFPARALRWAGPTSRQRVPVVRALPAASAERGGGREGVPAARTADSPMPVRPPSAQCLPFPAISRRAAAAGGLSVSLDSMMRELEGVRDQGSPTQQAAPKTWSLAGWRHLEASARRGRCFLAAGCLQAGSAVGAGRGRGQHGSTGRRRLWVLRLPMACALTLPASSLCCACASPLPAVAAPRGTCQLAWRLGCFCRRRAGRADAAAQPVPRLLLRIRFEVSSVLLNALLLCCRPHCRPASHPQRTPLLPRRRSGLPPSLRRLRLQYEPFVLEEHAEAGMAWSFSLMELPESARWAAGPRHFLAGTACPPAAPAPGPVAPLLLAPPRSTSHPSCMQPLRCHGCRPRCCRLDELVVEKFKGWVALDWACVSRRCRRLVIHGGLGATEGAGSGELQVGGRGMHGRWSGNAAAVQLCFSHRTVPSQLESLQFLPAAAAAAATTPAGDDWRDPGGGGGCPLGGAVPT